VPNCGSCLNLTQCSGCLPGFSLVNSFCVKSCADRSISIGVGSNSSCKPCSTISGLCNACSFLNNSFSCNICSPVAYLLGNGTCAICSSSLPNCLQCSSSSNCNICTYPYSLVNGSCISVSCNIANCLLCSITNSSICQTCASGFTYNSSTLICSPPQCSSGFIVSNGACVCAPFTMLSINICVSCPNSCVTCSNQGCLSCSSGYYLAFNQSCLVCAANCVSCTSIICTQCSNGFSLQNDGICQSVGRGVSSAISNNLIIQCSPGCLVCISAALDQVICTVAQTGYSVVAGVATKCSNSMCLTCISGEVSCSSCFDGYSLIGGSCIACLDANAISCLSTNLNYSTLCAPKYSAAVSSTSAGGYCLPCSINCLKCDINGPGNCDPLQCMLGFVQLTGTLNCTACYNSCPICDSNDLNLCLNCGPRRYNNGLGSCLNCSNGCQVCTSALTCSICQFGYTIIGGICSSNLNYPCAIMNSNSQCSQCFQYYALSGSTCVIDLSCSSSKSCLGCPYGYYLMNSSCLACPSLPNCLTCNPNSQCVLCQQGYFLSNNSCSACNIKCKDCSSLTFCN